MFKFRGLFKYLWINKEKNVSLFEIVSFHIRQWHYYLCLFIRLCFFVVLIQSVSLHPDDFLPIVVQTLNTDVIFFCGGLILYDNFIFCHAFII
jgi:hypothetical protein